MTGNSETDFISTAKLGIARNLMVGLMFGKIGTNETNVKSLEVEVSLG